jgi:class 3 adenylate cyclase
MMWDIVGFSDTLERLLPEELVSVLGENVVGVCGRSIEESSGYVLQNIGNAGLAFWLQSPSETSHALLAFRCGVSICRRLSQPKSPDPRPHVRITLGTGAMVGGLIVGRRHIVGVACTTATRLQKLDLPRRTSMLYTSETLAFVEGETPRTEPVARFTRTTGGEVEVYEYCDHGS